MDTFPIKTSIKEKSILLSDLLDPVNYERGYTENGTVFMEEFTERIEVDHLLLFIDPSKKITSLLMVSSTCKNFLFIDYLHGINQNAIWLNSGAGISYAPFGKGLWSGSSEGAATVTQFSLEASTGP